ncbi:MAG: hypothetical protein R3F61_13580 [Myxococcota bacterium]
MRSLLLLVVLLSGCHGRFRRSVDSLSEVRLAPDTRVEPDVDLGRIYTADPGVGGMMADSYNLSQMLRENRMSAIVTEKLDPDQVSSAFAFGIRERLGDGPPFAAVDQADARIELNVVDWGLSAGGYPFPAMFTYKVRARGVRSDGTRFYRATFRCTGDAGEARWIDAFGFGTANARGLETLPAEVVQETFDKAAFQCGHQFAEKLRYHAGL